MKRNGEVVNARRMHADKRMGVLLAKLDGQLVLLRRQFHAGPQEAIALEGKLSVEQARRMLGLDAYNVPHGQECGCCLPALMADNGRIGLFPEAPFVFFREYR